MGDQRLRPSERLRRSDDYRRVFQCGKKLAAPAFVLYVLPRPGSRSRLGMAVSKRVGGAVVRNRVKRLIRELFRRYKAQLRPPCDVVFVARREAARASLREYTQQFLALLCRCQRMGEEERGCHVPRARTPLRPSEGRLVQQQRKR
jgi:ribonuclease P protein component